MGAGHCTATRIDDSVIRMCDLIRRYMCDNPPAQRKYNAKERRGSKGTRVDCGGSSVFAPSFPFPILVSVESRRPGIRPPCLLSLVVFVVVVGSIFLFSSFLYRWTHARARAANPDTGYVHFHSLSTQDRQAPTTWPRVASTTWPRVASRLVSRLSSRLLQNHHHSLFSPRAHTTTPSDRTPATVLFLPTTMTNNTNQNNTTQTQSNRCTVQKRRA